MIVKIKRKALIINSVFPTGVGDLSVLRERYSGRFSIINKDATLSGCCFPGLLALCGATPREDDEVGVNANRFSN